MRPVPAPPSWKAAFLPGLLLGVLLALLQVALLFWGPILGIPSLVDSFVPVWYLWLCYLVLPVCFGFLITVRTGERATGFRVGWLAGIFCAVLLLAATVAHITYTIANPPLLRLGGGAFLEMALMIELTISFFVNALGASLAAIGAFLGSRSWRTMRSLPRTEEPVVMPLPTRALPADRYQILEQVGEGGFGRVYKARDANQRGRVVAIKQINLSRLSPQEIIEATDSYNREVMLLSQLRHPNLPRIYDHFTDPEHWYVVMDFIQGETLEEHLKNVRGGRLPVKSVVTLVTTLCDALHYLHMQHPPIIFRDVKPGNIMYAYDGRVYLIDFGIARQYRPGKSKDTSPLGSPGYAAPEQYGKAQTTPRTDIYGLGATLQTLLTGKEPLALASSLEREKLLGKLPKRLQVLLQHMLERDAQHRPASMQEVKKRLQNLHEESPFERRVRFVARGMAWALLTPYLSVYLLYILFACFMVPTFLQSLLYVSCLLIGWLTIGLYQEIRREKTGNLPGKSVLTLLWQRLKKSRLTLLAVMAICGLTTILALLDISSLYLSFYRFLVVVVGFICIACAVVGVASLMISNLAALFAGLRRKRRLAQRAPVAQRQMMRQR